MNSYVFIRVVGKGSYGEVNLVKHKADRKQYVIKKLNLTKSTKRERRAAEQEAQLLSQLRHPNIVTYRESWEGEDCQLYIVMGFCEGGDLYHRLKQQKGELLPERQVVEWFVQIAMALQYLHEKHILHRDLKTQNIFLTKTNIIKVGDLGIARVLENQNDMASTLIGTPYYMSPELFSNKPYNHKSDVWALGCCVYEMSTLKHAFNAKDMNSLVYRIVQGKLPQMPGKYDPLLDQLIKSMLCKRPEERPDVKVILRQPYIKRQIATFLEATKEKTAKSKKKAVDGSGDSSGVSPQPNPRRTPQSPPALPLAKPRTRDSVPQQGQNVVVSASPSADALNASAVSMGTISGVNIDIQSQPPVGGGEEPPPRSVSRDRKHMRKPAPTRGPLSPHPSPGHVSDDRYDTMELLREAARENPPPGLTATLSSVALDVPEQSSAEEGLPEANEREASRVKPDAGGDTVVLLRGAAAKDLPSDGQEPHEDKSPSSHQVSMLGLAAPNISMELYVQHRRREAVDKTKSRPLPPPPAEALTGDRRKRSRAVPEKKRTNTTTTATSSSSSIRPYEGLLPIPQERPPSARERRRLRQSQEQVVQPVVNANERLDGRRSDEEDCSSSTSSTERSEGEGREGKSESTDMQDLVQMMTLTLGMDVRDSITDAMHGSAALPEFKLNRKYRDTLVLHGKAWEQSNFPLNDLPMGSTSGPAKIRRAIECLRTDVVKGLGVKMLDRVLELMEEDDEDKLKVCLRQHMGEDKYQTYAVMVRQLKFFEDVSFKG
ncbi:hypothetical protein NHX12_031050 [Muraenolepis orangiensis]|uniref:Serine/threonine-protein kinase Nek4 n=1 Tax=Muraenolepis orangiensis TaxID=630683 RepID=A0A9Q0EBG6_9TELE|nr:hypothetical protein NHX12_031050 [Muraenolepis orangiensis]